MSGAVEACGGFEGEPPERLQGRRDAGYYYRDPRAGVQAAGGWRLAAGGWRWCAAVNATGEFGHWEYMLAPNVLDLAPFLTAARQHATCPEPPRPRSSVLDLGSIEAATRVDPRAAAPDNSARRQPKEPPA